MEKYKIVFDNGKPYTKEVLGEEELEKSLKDFFEENKEDDFGFNAIVYNDKDEDISESQFISEMIGEIIGE